MTKQIHKKTRKEKKADRQTKRKAQYIRDRRGSKAFHNSHNDKKSLGLTLLIFVLALTIIMVDALHPLIPVIIIVILIYFTIYSIWSSTKGADNKKKSKVKK